jgi:DNA polymerase III delta subunit
MLQGEHPLRLLATIVSDVRRLLAARHFIDGELREKWREEMGYPQFQKDVLKEGAPLLTRNAYADYLSFQRAGNVTTQELVRVLALISDTDIRLKSSGGSPRMAMERLVLEMCHGSGQAAGPDHVRE